MISLPYLEWREVAPRMLRLFYHIFSRPLFSLFYTGILLLGTQNIFEIFRLNLTNYFLSIDILSNLILNISPSEKLKKNVFKVNWFFRVRIIYVMSCFPQILNICKISFYYIMLNFVHRNLSSIVYIMHNLNIKSCRLLTHEKCLFLSFSSD